MKILRIALGVLVGAYGLFCLFPILTNAAYKAGQMPDPTGEAARMAPLWEATPWWQLAVWLVVVALLLVAAWRLIRGGRAFPAYAAAFAVDMVLWGFMKTMPVYREVFTPAELQLDYYILAGMVLVGAAIWWTERRPTAAAAA